MNPVWLLFMGCEIHEGIYFTLTEWVSKHECVCVCLIEIGSEEEMLVHKSMTMVKLMIVNGENDGKNDCDGVQMIMT